MKYKKVKVSRGETRDEHRLIIEKKLGRRLSFNEIVHHKDGIKSNNNESNLVVMTRSEHSRLHMIGRKLGDSTKEKLRMCGIKHRANGKLTDENVLSIRSDLLNGISAIELAKKYNVDRGAIYQIKWNKTYYWLK